MPKSSKRSRPSKGQPKRPPDRPDGPRRPVPLSGALGRHVVDPEVDDWEPPTVRIDIGHDVAGGPVHRARLEDRVISLVNNARQRAGVPVLQGDERLRASARAFSTRMARLGFFAHEDPNGWNAGDRMRAAGHPAPGGENIAQGQDSPEEVMQSWLNSPGHRANIVRPEFRSIGVGIHHGPDGPWWTQHFGY